MSSLEAKVITMPSGNVRNTRDSFLHFLADNQPSVTIHPVRMERDSPSSNTLQVNSLNVAFHDATYSSGAPTSQFVTIDILHEDELEALDIEESTVALLQKGAATPLLDYTIPASPVSVSKRLIYWKSESIKFRTVVSPDYYHRSCVLELWLRYV